ncbi:MAG: hypothetical protein GTN78_05020 [Gemmatimonadales bacterium]|nr:hypothetical protein [Gemmatimonadales bacterium]
MAGAAGNNADGSGRFMLKQFAPRNVGQDAEQQEVKMVDAATLSPWVITGARSMLLSRVTRPRSALSSARAVRTQSGIALFDESGRYVGMVTAPAGKPAFGPGADTVLLRRWD